MHSNEALHRKFAAGKLSSNHKSSASCKSNQSTISFRFFWLLPCVVLALFSLSVIDDNSRTLLRTSYEPFYEVTADLKENEDSSSESNVKSKTDSTTNISTKTNETNFSIRPDWPKLYQKYPADQAPKTNICFVHVGKSAGSTLSCYLGFMHGRCKRWKKDGSPVIKLPKAPGLLPDSVTNMIHNGWNDCTDQTFSYFLFVVRDPIKRLQSWFTYESPLNTPQGEKYRYWKKIRQLYIECFDTLNELGEVGLSVNENTQDDSLTTCQQRARWAVTGQDRYAYHNYYNYEYYLDQVRQYQTNAISKILVIRSEHLEKDWKSIEEDVLDGSRNLNVTFEQTNASPKRAKDYVLSAKARKQICKWLCYEIQTYKFIIQKAINLSEDEKEISMQELSASCPKEALSSTCEIKLDDTTRSIYSAVI